MSKIDKNKKKIIAIISGIILIAIIVFLLWFFNRKFDVTFDLNNGTKEEIIKVKYHQTINEKDIKDQKDLGESFIAWYEVVGIKEKEDVLADKPFDFNTKINKAIKLKALYEGKVETITITFDSKGGSAVDPITINKGTELILPKDPTYAGYTFKGWYDTNETPIHNNALLEEDTTLYAKWKKISETKPEPKKEEKISLSLSRDTLHVNGIKTATAAATVENSSGKVTYSLSDTNCMTINENTGAISVSSNPKNCSNGATITVTAKTPSGKSATATIYYEKDLVLTHDGKTYTQDDTTSGKSSTFTVNANQNVSWNIDAAVKPSYRYTYNDYKNKTATSVTGGYTIDSIVESTGAISKITTDVKVTATTKAEQKISLIIKQYVA
ncbi:MAG: InlB B-repeat-containing protein [Firmicutes bacterium]|nr:InlB B-repeat-containing protein [Bacillota bacterium]MDY5336030.1 InlB B-repeat-containing protein [Bacilli bacterium]